MTHPHDGRDVTLCKRLWDTCKAPHVMIDALLDLGAAELNDVREFLELVVAECEGTTVFDEAVEAITDPHADSNEVLGAAIWAVETDVLDSLPGSVDLEFASAAAASWICSMIAGTFPPPDGFGRYVRSHLSTADWTRLLGQVLGFELKPTDQAQSERASGSRSDGG